MGYLVLARKYRPQSFGEMSGQEHVVRTLSNALRSGHLAHAFLFTGPRGVGKTTCARLVAKCLDCVKGPTAEPCGTCAPCVEIAEGRCVDVVEIDAASNNGVDNVRDIVEAVKYRPARDRFKIFIVDEVHMLSQGAQTPHGAAVGPCTQLRHFATRRALVVFPTPRGPVKRKACASWPVFRAFESVRTTCSWPDICPNRCGRYFRARTR